MKVYFYYHDDLLYGFTNDKKLKSLFEDQRNMDVFKKRTLSMSKSEYEKLSSDNYNLELRLIEYSDCNDYYKIVSTNTEERCVEEYADTIMNDIEDLRYKLDKLNLKDKYNKAFEYLLNTVELITGGMDTIMVSNINNMYLFTVLYKETLNI